MSTPTIPRILQISIHALRKESDNIDMMVINSLEISIHALRKESDGGWRAGTGRTGISIHALRKESDGRMRFGPVMRTFQSTLSVRRAT